MEKYKCNAVDTDVLSVYLAEDEIGCPMAFILENAQGHKVSALLNKQQTEHLISQLRHNVKEMK